MARREMPSRKVPNQSKNREALGFTTDDIVRAIEGKQRAYPSMP
jgi:hypothetical protein